MKLSHLKSTTQSIPLEAAERLRHAPTEAVLRVNAMEGIEGDRQRSLQQEINEIDPNAIGRFRGNQHILEDVRELAAEIAAMGKQADHLMKQINTNGHFHAIDDQA